MKHGLVPYHRALADHQRVAEIRDVQHRAVLNVRPRADADEVDVAAGRGVEPERNVLAQRHVAHQVGAGGQEHAGPQGWPPPLVGMNRHGRIAISRLGPPPAAPRGESSRRAATAWGTPPGGPRPRYRGRPWRAAA